MKVFLYVKANKGNKIYDSTGCKRAMNVFVVLMEEK